MAAGVSLMLAMRWMVWSAFTETVVLAGEYCWYSASFSTRVKIKYCEQGCCNDHGDDDEICCFSWSIGVILGVALGTLAVIAGIAVLIVCCVMASKKRGRVGNVVSHGDNMNNGTVVYPGGTSTIHSFSYPHPPSAFYPASQYPSAPPYPDPAYPPSQQFGAPPSYSVATGNPSVQSGQHSNTGGQYGGYGKGLNN